MDTVSALSSLSSSLNSQPPSSHFSPVFGGQRGRGSEQGRALQEGSHAGVACSVPLCSLPRQVFKTSPRDVCSNVGKLGRKAPTLPLSAAPQSSPVSLPGPLLPPDPKGAGLGSGNPASRGSRAPPPHRPKVQHLLWVRGCFRTPQAAGTPGGTGRAAGSPAGDQRSHALWEEASNVTAAELLLGHLHRGSSANPTALPTGYGLSCVPPEETCWSRHPSTSDVRVLGHSGFREVTEAVSVGPYSP